MVVGQKTTAYVVSCKTAESCSLEPDRCWSTVTCLVHGQELADTMKPGLENRSAPSQTPVLVDTLSEAAITTNREVAQAAGQDPSSQREKLTGRCTRGTGRGRKGQRETKG